MLRIPILVLTWDQHPLADSDYLAKSRNSQQNKRCQQDKTHWFHQNINNLTRFQQYTLKIIRSSWHHQPGNAPCLVRAEIPRLPIPRSTLEPHKHFDNCEFDQDNRKNGYGYVACRDWHKAKSDSKHLCGGQKIQEIILSTRHDQPWNVTWRFGQVTHT